MTPVSTLQIPRETQSYSRLSYSPIVKIVDAHSVDILIGPDNSHALIPINVARGKRRDPYAVRTLFSRSLHRMSKEVLPTRKRVIHNFVTCIESRVSKLWNMEPL